MLCWFACILYIVRIPGEHACLSACFISQITQWNVIIRIAVTSCPLTAGSALPGNKGTGV
jgi:hypothetical protein